MKLRTKIVLTILLAFLVWALVDFFAPDTDVAEFHDSYASVGAAKKPTAESLAVDYRAYNEEYFGNKLPKDTVIGFDERNPEFLASTTHSSPSFIEFNPAYDLGFRHTRLVLLHEMCHVRVGQTWDDNGGHGIRWRVCMLSVDMQGAFRTLLIDGYQERTP
jgi:predicted SprT family Zn-dependent metalloprotease